MIFISHSRKDDSTANLICECLEKNDIECWLDHRDAKPGSQWEHLIVSAIKDSDLMLLVFSNHANVSKHVGREITLAAKNEIDIIPIKMEEFHPSTKFEYYLADIQWYNAIGVPIENHLNNLLDRVNDFLNKIKGKSISKPTIETEWFKGIFLPKKEVEFLKEIEFITGESFEYVESFMNIANTEFENLSLVLNDEDTINGIGILDCNLEEIPESMRNIENLNILLIDNTNLKSIPEWFSELKHIDFLSFYKNNLKNLPENFVDLNYLEVLDLNHNNISFLPESIGNMDFQYLYLSNNNLQTLPFSFANISGIIELSENPLAENPGLKTRYILSSLKRMYDNVDIDLPKFNFDFDFERDKNIINRIDELIYDYDQLNIVSSEDMYDSERKKKRICFELITIGYASIDYLIDVFLGAENAKKSTAKGILDFIFVDIEPNWKEIIMSDN